jgi:predicted AlkP superfamily phosphohydrolase/phosphomutase
MQRMGGKTAATRPRVLLLGFDCADVDLVEQWSREGYMPHCAALRGQGTFRRLRTTSEIMHVSAWPTLYTGTTPGQHGASHAYQLRSGEQEIRFADPRRFSQAPFWKHLDDAGRRCIVFDAFASALVEPFHGVQIQEYGTWTWFGAQRSTPHGMLGDITRRFGAYPAPEHTKLVHVPRDLPGYRDQLVAGAGVKSRIAQALLREQQWDVAFISFAEAHAGGHYLWHAGDRGFPLRPPGVDDGTQHLLRDVYCAVDKAIGDIVANVDDSTTVIVMSVDGMGPNYSGSHFMPEMLHRMGVFDSNTVGQDRRRGHGTVPPRSATRRLREAVPMSVRQAVTHCLPRCLQQWRQLMWLNSGVDWDKSQVFCIPSSDEAFFRINLRGREPRGIVEPGGEYQDLLESIRQQLTQLKNPCNECDAVEQVILMDSACPGPRRQDLPDAVVKWNAGARIGGALRSVSCGTIEMPASYQVPPFYTGNHRNVAFATMRGPTTPQNVEVAGGHILDVAPTILSILGVDPPAHFEGNRW